MDHLDYVHFEFLLLRMGKLLHILIPKKYDNSFQKIYKVSFVFVGYRFGHSKTQTFRK